MPGTDGSRGDLVNWDAGPRVGEVMAPQPRVENAGALAKVVAGEVVAGVVADGAVAGVRRAPALAEEVGLLARQPSPSGSLGDEDLGVPIPVGPQIPRPVAAAGEPVHRPERPLGHAATLTDASEVVWRDHRWLWTRPASTNASSVARSRRTYLPTLT